MLISLSGNFTQILKFLEMISRVPKLLTFDNVEVRKAIAMAIGCDGHGAEPGL